MTLSNPPTKNQPDFFQGNGWLMVNKTYFGKRISLAIQIPCQTIRKAEAAIQLE